MHLHVMLAWQRMATEGCALHHDNPRKKRSLWSLPSWFDCRWCILQELPAAPAKILWLSITNTFNRQMPVFLVYRSSIPIETAALAIENAFTNLFFLLLSHMSHTSLIIREKLGKPTFPKYTHLNSIFFGEHTMDL